MENKEKLGFTAGNFDLLHPGYIYTFEEAKKHCDTLWYFCKEILRKLDLLNTSQ